MFFSAHIKLCWVFFWWVFSQKILSECILLTKAPTHSSNWPFGERAWPVGQQSYLTSGPEQSQLSTNVSGVSGRWAKLTLPSPVGRIL